MFLAQGGAVLFQWTNDHWELVGIESDTSTNSSRNSYRSLFVRVAAYNPWIESIAHPDNSISVALETITSFNPFAPYECDKKAPCGCSYEDVLFRPTRLIGGQDAIEGSWSMIVSLRFYESDEHFCAGTLLSKSFVLTAAHCVDHFLSATTINITVYAGVTRQSDSTGYERRVTEIHIHPNYTRRPLFLNNLALLQLDRPLVSINNPVLSKTCVHRMNPSISMNEQYPKNDTPLVIVGWGAMRPGSFQSSDYLRQKQVNPIENRDPICQNASSSPELQFCAGLYDVVQGKWNTFLLFIRSHVSSI